MRKALGEKKQNIRNIRKKRMSPMERDKRQISESSDPETALTFSRKLLGELAVPQRSQKQRLSL